MAASQQWGVPPELIAAVIRVESTGEPGVISPSGARGLMQMMPDQIGGQGVPQSLWHDPATNVAAGAQGLYTRMLAQGSWEGAVGAYLGFGCDIWDTCTDAYVRAVFGWAAYYQPVIADPRHSGLPDPAQGLGIRPDRDLSASRHRPSSRSPKPKNRARHRPAQPRHAETRRNTGPPGAGQPNPGPDRRRAAHQRPTPTFRRPIPTAVPTTEPTVVPTEPPPPPTEAPTEPPAESPRHVQPD